MTDAFCLEEPGDLDAEPGRTDNAHDRRAEALGGDRRCETVRRGDRMGARANTRRHVGARCEQVMVGERSEREGDRVASRLTQPRHELLDRARAVEKWEQHRKQRPHRRPLEHDHPLGVLE